MTDDELNEFWASAGCFLAGFATTPCEGRLIRAHLVPKQLIRRECGSLSPKGWRFIADDPRCWVWACGGITGCSAHHGAFDVARTIRIPRSGLPPELELFAAEFGLLWWLTRTYGPLSEELAA